MVLQILNVIAKSNTEVSAVVNPAYVIPDGELKKINVNDIESIELFFKKPSVLGLLEIFIMQGGYLAIVVFVVLTYFFIRMAYLLTHLRDSCSKIPENNTDNSPIAAPEMKDINFLQNCSNCFALFFDSNIDTTLAKAKSVDKIVQFNILIVVFGISSLFILCITRLILAYSFRQFREKFIVEFFQKVEIQHFANPQKCTKFLNTIFGNIENLLENILNMFFCFGSFIFFFSKCFIAKEQYKNKWSLCMFGWLLMQLVCTVLLFLSNKPSDTSLKIAEMEQGNILTIESEKLFKSFSNGIAYYQQLLNQQLKEKTQKELLNFGIMAIGGISTLLTIGLGLIFCVFPAGLMYLVIVSLEQMFQNFYKIPVIVNKILLQYSGITDVCQPMKCSFGQSGYITIPKNELYKQMNEQQKSRNVSSLNPFNSKFSREDYLAYLQRENPNFHVGVYGGYGLIATKKITGPIKLITIKEIIFRTIKNPFSIKLGPGIVLICGPSGSGKTSLCQLLMRFYLPESGIIRYNGVPLSHVNINDLYTKLFAILQFSQALPAGKARDIIFNTISKEEQEEAKQKGADQEEFLRKAFEESGFLQFFPDIPIDSILIQQGGKNLSGGMCSLLAFLMVLLQSYYSEFLSKQKVLGIFDEPCASLDKKNGIRVMKKLMQITLSFKLIGFFIDHTSIFLRLILYDPEFSKVNYKIIFFGEDGVLSGTLEQLKAESKEFREWLSRQLENFGKDTN